MNRRSALVWALALLPIPNARAQVRSRPKGITVTVGSALANQRDLRRLGEHCGIAADLASRQGWTVGQQVRVRRGDLTALYTIGLTWRGPAEGPGVRIGQGNRLRLAGFSQPFDAEIEAFGPHPELSDRQARAQGEFVERLIDDGRQTELLVLAPHGGAIERNTDEQARLLVERLGRDRASAWYCLGYELPAGHEGPSAFVRWHITSSDLNERSFPKLGAVGKRRFAHAVSFHGTSANQIIIGGAGPRELREEVRSEIDRTLKGKGQTVRLAKTGEALDGDHPRNIVNRYARAGGIQIEQSPRARRDHAVTIAEAVARVFERRLRMQSPLKPDQIPGLS